MSSPINCGAVAMIGGLILVPIVSLVTPKLQKEKVDNMFTCYDEQVTVSAKQSLGEIK